MVKKTTRNGSEKKPPHISAKNLFCVDLKVSMLKDMLENPRNEFTRKQRFSKKIMDPQNFWKNFKNVNVFLTKIDPFQTAANFVAYDITSKFKLVVLGR